MVVSEDFRDILRDVRAKRELSIYELARRAGLPYTTVRSYENGVAPSIKNFVKLLDVLGMKIELSDVVGEGGGDQ